MNDTYRDIELEMSGMSRAVDVIEMASNAWPLGIRGTEAQIIQTPTRLEKYIFIHKLDSLEKTFAFCRSVL
jgi:hypothetical protein